MNTLREGSVYRTPGNRQLLWKVSRRHNDVFLAKNVSLFGGEFYQVFRSSSGSVPLNLDDNFPLNFTTPKFSAAIDYFYAMRMHWIRERDKNLAMRLLLA